MEVKVIIDYKVVLALGVVTIGSIAALRMDPMAIRDVSIHAIDAAKELTITINSNC